MTHRGSPEKLKFSVARAGARIGEALPRFGNELPVIGVGLEGELQDSEGCRIAQFAVGLWRAERAVILTARANDEFANAALGVGRAVRSLGSKALIIMIMAADNHVCVGFIEGLPEGLHSQIIAMRTAGTEQGLVRSEERRVGKECRSRWSPD